MEKLEGKLDKISEDVAYMRGQFDTVLPTITKQAERILDLEKAQENIKTKVGMAGAGAGLVSAGVVEWILRHFNI